MPIIIPGFKGGMANSLFDPLSKQTFQSANGLDVFTYPNILVPHHTIANDVTDKTPNKTKLDFFYKASDGIGYFKGFDESGGTVLTIWDASSGALGSTVSLTAETVATGAGGAHGMVEFLSNLWLFQTSSVIQRFDFSSITAAVVSTVSDTAPIFVHEGLAKMFYTVSAYQIGASADITPANTAVITFDNSITIAQMAALGQFVVIGLNKKNAAGPSQLAIWDGASSTLEDLINLGDTGIQSVVNVNGEIYVITSSNTHGWGSKNLIRIYKLERGRMRMKKELDLQATATGAITVLPNAVAVRGSKIYFGIKTNATATAMTIDNGVFAYDTDQDVLTLDRVVSDTTGIDITSVAFNGGAMVVTWYDGTDYHLSHVVSSPSVSALGKYISNAFPLANGRPDTIKRILLNHKSLPTSCGFTVKVKHFGYPIGGSIPAADSFANLLTPQGNSATSGFTQSTTNATYTLIENSDKFKEARFAQLEIDWDEVSGLNAAEIIFPIFIDTVGGHDKM